VSFATFDITACKAPRDTKEKLVQSIVSVIQLHSSQSTSAVPNRLDIHILQPQAHCSTRASAKATVLFKRKAKKKEIYRRALRCLSSNAAQTLSQLEKSTGTRHPSFDYQAATLSKHIKRMWTTRPCSFSRGFTQRGKHNIALGRTTEEKRIDANEKCEVVLSGDGL
jgi:hypothetical protein